MEHLVNDDVFIDGADIGHLDLRQVRALVEEVVHPPGVWSAGDHDGGFPVLFLRQFMKGPCFT